MKTEQAVKSAGESMNRAIDSADQEPDNKVKQNTANKKIKAYLNALSKYENELQKEISFLKGFLK